MTDMPASLSRRNFVSQIASLGAFWAFATTIPLPVFAESLADDRRISQTPLVDAGFASVRKIGEGTYATISDPSKGFATICNGGFLVGKDSAFLIEGFCSPAGAAFQMETLRKVSQVPVMAALVMVVRVAITPSGTHSMERMEFRFGDMLRLANACLTVTSRCKALTGPRFSRGSKSASANPKVTVQNNMRKPI